MKPSYRSRERHLVDLTFDCFFTHAVHGRRDFVHNFSFVASKFAIKKDPNGSTLSEATGNGGDESDYPSLTFTCNSCPAIESTSVSTIHKDSSGRLQRARDGSRFPVPALVHIPLIKRPGVISSAGRSDLSEGSAQELYRRGMNREVERVPVL